MILLDMIHELRNDICHGDINGGEGSGGEGGRLDPSSIKAKGGFRDPYALSSFLALFHHIHA